jgi:hypothetical protein
MKADRYLLILGIGFVISSIVSSAGFDMGSALFPAHAAEETTADMLADHVRRQGYRCDTALSAARDAERSKPDEAVWVLKCTNVTYRLTVIPDMAWNIERVD